MKTVRLFILLCCLGILSILKVKAQNTYALIVGISQYKEMPALQYADRDAIAFAEFVKSQGTPDSNIKLFLNEEASRLNIVDELYKLSQMAKPQDLFTSTLEGMAIWKRKLPTKTPCYCCTTPSKLAISKGRNFCNFLSSNLV